MRKNVYVTFLVILACSATVAFGFSGFGAAQTKIWTVDSNGHGDFTGIQSAINAANPGDTIYVKNRVYYQPVNISKAVSLVGESCQQTVLDGSQIVIDPLQHLEYRDGICPITIAADNVSISGLRISGFKEVGCYVKSSHITLTGNTFEAASPETVVNGHVISSTAIWTENSSYLTISHNSVSNVATGIDVGGCTCNNTINANSVSAASIAIGVVSAYGDFSNASITDNVVTGQGEFGISLEAGEYNRVSGNVVIGAYNQLMALFGTSHDTVFNNTLYSAKTYQLVLMGVSNDVLYHNNFLGNPDLTCVSPSNVWANGYPSGGNYWAIYQGVDNFSGPYQNITGSDGIGDTAFISNSTGRAIIDAYPLMQPTMEIKLPPTPTAVPTGTPSAPNTMPPSTPKPTVIPSKTSISKVNNLLNLQVTGNITSNQMSNLALTTNFNSSTTLSFTVTGPTGTTGFGNITIAKRIVPYGTTPLVTINGTRASNQGYTQDSSNYYVWYTTHFSTQQVSIIFTITTTPTNPTTSSSGLQNPALSLGWVQIAILALMGIILASAGIAAFRFLRKRGTEQTKSA